MVDATAVLFA